MEPLVEYVERVDVWAATIEDKPGGLRIYWLSCGTRAQTWNSSSLGAQNPAKE